MHTTVDVKYNLRFPQFFLLWEKISMNQIYMSKVISELMFYSWINLNQELKLKN